MKNDYELTLTKTIIAPNGTQIPICTDGQRELIPLSRLAYALGYCQFRTSKPNNLSTVFKNREFTLFISPNFSGGGSAYYCDVQQIIAILSAFCRLTLITRSPNPATNAATDTKRMEAERLIDIFNRELFGKADTCTVTRIPQNFQDTSEEVTQMENNETIQANVPPLTMRDIEEIGERAEATVKIFGVSKTDALRAATQLKAQEINRDLSPLLELLR